jgi:hypothetical protein
VLHLYQMALSNHKVLAAKCEAAHRLHLSIHNDVVQVDNNVV